MKGFAGKRILVVGMGRSGVACARFLKDGGGRVTVTDSGDDAALGQAAALLRGIGVSVALGGHPTGIFADAELIVLSPGVPHTLAPLEDARKRGVPVMGEIELASRFVEEPMVAVTGTNGKTTTTTLIGRMLEASGLRTFVGGNIGTPLIEYVAGGDRCDRVVVEVSSFQLDTIERFHPSVGVLLNITPDHLDRYEDFNAYARSKGRLFENQGSSDVAVLNGADPATEAISAGEYRRCDPGGTSGRRDPFRGRCGPEGLPGASPPDDPGGHHRRRPLHRRLQGHEPGCRAPGDRVL